MYDGDISGKLFRVNEGERLQMCSEAKRQSHPLDNG
jgi:hypothetical protein